MSNFCLAGQGTKDVIDLTEEDSDTAQPVIQHNPYASRQRSIWFFAPAMLTASVLIPYFAVPYCRNLQWTFKHVALSCSEVVSAAFVQAGKASMYAKQPEPALSTEHADASQRHSSHFIDILVVLVTVGVLSIGALLVVTSMLQMQKRSLAAEQLDSECHNNPTSAQNAVESVNESPKVLTGNLLMAAHDHSCKTFC